MRFFAIAALCLFASTAMAEESRCFPTAEGVAQIEAFALEEKLPIFELRGDEAQAFLNIINAVAPVSNFSSDLVVALVVPAEGKAKFTFRQPCGISMRAIGIPIDLFMQTLIAVRPAV